MNGGNGKWGNWGELGNWGIGNRGIRWGENGGAMMLLVLLSHVLLGGTNFTRHLLKISYRLVILSAINWECIVLYCICCPC